MNDVPNPDGHDVQHALGLDLGQSGDPSALTVVRQLTPYSLEKERKRPHGPGIKVTKEHGTTRYEVVWIEQFDLGTPYTEIVERVAHVKGYPPGDTPLALDATGVGAPVVDMFKEEGVIPKEITFTGGKKVKRDGHSFSVPKKDLATTVQTLLQTGRLKIAEELPHAGTLVREMKTFRVKIGASGHARFEHAMEGDTDDILMSLACAIWFLESGDTLPQRPRSRQYTDWSRMLP
jgi:hypothetical protein